MRRMIMSLAAMLVVGQAASAAKLEVAYPSMERMIVKHYLTEGGRRYLRGGPEDTCAYAFIQEPRVSVSGERLSVRFLFAGRAGTEVAGKCVGAGDNFDIVVSGIPRFGEGELFLDDAAFEADHKLFDVFSPLIRAQIEPLLRVRAQPSLERYLGLLTAAGAGTVALESFNIDSISLDTEGAVLDAELVVSVKP